MPGNLASNRVLSGRLAGFTKAEVLALWTTYKADPFAVTITSTTIDGQSISFGTGLTTTEKARILQSALAQVDPVNWSNPGQRISVRFGSQPC